jgi:hypothetical protein
MPQDREIGYLHFNFIVIILEKLAIKHGNTKEN